MKKLTNEKNTNNNEKIINHLILQDNHLIILPK